MFKLLNIQTIEGPV